MAVRTGGALGHQSLERRARIAGEAPGAVQLAMHMQQPGRAGAVVQVVDILRHQQQLARPFCVQPSQRLVRRIGMDGLQLGAALVIEILDHFGIAGKGLWRCDILDPVALPQAVRPAKGGDAAFGADPSAGQDDDILDVFHAPHHNRSLRAKSRSIWRTWSRNRGTACLEFARHERGEARHEWQEVA